jgi:hypothetical protein
LVFAGAPNSDNQASALHKGTESRYGFADD